MVSVRNVANRSLGRIADGLDGVNGKHIALVDCTKLPSLIVAFCVGIAISILSNCHISIYLHKN
jgi:hypothetical protein